jgi:hypothetical protein
MRKPKLETNCKAKVAKEYDDRLHAILRYILDKKKMKSFDEKLFKMTQEPVQNYSRLIATYRYNGELWVRSFPQGLYGVPEWKFEIYV